MHERVKRLSGNDLISALGRLGFKKVRQRGSHVVMKSSMDATVGCVIPVHRELAPGTLRGILKQACISVEELLKVL